MVKVQKDKTKRNLVDAEFMRDGTSGAGTAYHSGAHEFTPVYSGVCVAQSFVFCIVFCRSVSFWPLYCHSSIYGF